MGYDLISRSVEPRDAVLTFGPFEFHPRHRLLLDSGRQVRLGSRASELLAALVERCGEVLTKRELMARAWAGLFVEEVNLRIHIAVLRKVLRDCRAAPRYIRTISGRGYSFVAPIGQHYWSASPTPPASQAQNGVPATLTRVIGRADAVEAITRQLKSRRMVTIVGPGGIGKTTVALAAAERLAAQYAQKPYFVDLSDVGDPKQVPATLATALGVEAATADPGNSIVAFLRDAKILLILDNCEHVIEGAALLVERLLQGAPRVDLLATSRESLLVPGESVCRLDALRLPAPTASLTAEQARTYSAIELFVEHATRNFEDFVLTDDNVFDVATICSQLDGIPLAIEHAAARVSLLGIKGLMTQVDERVLLLSKGRRTAQRRHQSLQAMLDWSYDTLHPHEQMILRRVSVFGNAFSAEAAAAVVADEKLTDSSVREGLLVLVGKSLAMTEFSGEGIAYRLLQTTRAYAYQLLEGDPSERAATLRRHAAHLHALLTHSQSGCESTPRSQWVIHASCRAHTPGGGQVDSLSPPSPCEGVEGSRRLNPPRKSCY